MPLAPQRVWAAIQAAKAGHIPPAWVDPPAAMNAAPAAGKSVSAAELEAAAGA
jgi:hypothetical protein